MNIYKRGEIFWCKFRIDKKIYQYSCKTKDKSVAVEIASAIHADTVRNRFDIPAKNISQHLSFTEAYQNYLKNISNVKKWTHDKAAILNNHFLPLFENKEIKEISRIDIKNYQLKRKLETINLPKNQGKRESEISFRSANVEMSILHNFFNFCIEKGYIDKNPATGIKKLNELSRLKTLSDEDIQKLISGATNIMNL